MAEEEVNYASVVFKSNKHPPPKAKTEEETVYDEVKVQSEKAADTNISAGFLTDKKADGRRRHYRQLACCLGILCVILLSGIIAVCVYLATLNHESDIKELNQLKENERTLLAANRNLTNLSKKFSSDNEILRRDNNNLTVQLGNLMQNYTVLESKITNLSAENQQLETQNQQLETQNQQLETQRNNLTEQIRDMETSWKELNISRAQWSIDAYCPVKNNERRCEACQDGWRLNELSCYAINNGGPPDQKTWEEAREDCRGKISDFAVVHTQREKDIINNYSWGKPGESGYWIGLRVEDGKWKWIDGSDLTVNSWIEAPTEGHCAVSVQNRGWKSMSCGDRQRWICKKKALSV